MVANLAVVVVAAAVAVAGPVEAALALAAVISW